MTERRNLLTSITNTIKDYRAGEIAEPTPDHVDRWISQFDGNVQIPMLRELDHVFKLTYISRDKALQLFRKIAGNFSCDFWRKAHILNIQRNGRSQFEIRNLFRQILRDQCGYDIDYQGSAGGDFVYLDDAIFTGDRVIEDFSYWLQNQAVENATLYIMVIALHEGGRYWIEQNEKRFKLGKQIDVRFWRSISFENRRTWRDQSGILVPTDILRPEEIGVRNLNQRASHFFSSVNGRQLLEREFLRAGTTIRGFASNPSQRLKPLGYSPFDPGFGSMFVTYRNCPNNCPLALWYGDPKFSSNHPFGRWYPLFPRKTYDQ